MMRNMFDLEKEIESVSCSGCYLFFSSEFFLIEKMVSKLVSSVLNKEFFAFNFKEFHGVDFAVNASDKKNKKKPQVLIDDLQNSLNILPVMSTYRVVLIKNLCYFETGKVFLKKFEEMVANLPETSILVVTVSTENFDFKKTKEFKLWLNDFSKLAKVFDCSFSSQKELFSFFGGWVDENDSKISQETFEFLVDRVSRNWQIVFKELEKLCAYAHGREILKSDVLELTDVNLSSTAFELADAILSLELKKALRMFRNLVELDVNLFLIVGAINTCFIDLFRVFVCSQKGLNNAQISEMFAYREYRIRKIRKFAVRFSIDKIKHCIKVLSKLDLKLKTVVVDKEVLIEKAIVEMVSGS